MDWVKQRRFAILATLSVLAVLWIAFSSESFQNCINAKNNADIEKSFYESFSRFLIALGVLRGCTSYFIGEAGNGITALATLIIAIFTLTLWRTSADQGVLTKIAIDEARSSSQRELRAYVSATPVKAFIADGQFGAIVRLENTGNTPAFETRCLWQLDVGAKPGKGDFEYKFENPNDDPIPTFVLYPKSAHTSVRTVTFSDTDFANFEKEDEAIRAFGIVFYVDAFGSDQTGKFYCYIDRAGYKMWLANYMAQPAIDRRPIIAPFKFTEGNNWASFSLPPTG